jgi:hypothetical protein
MEKKKEATMSSSSSSAAQLVVTKPLIDRLDKHSLASVLQFLPFGQLKMCARVCRFWHSTTYMPMCWRHASILIIPDIDGAEPAIVNKVREFIRVKINDAGLEEPSLHDATWGLFGRSAMLCGSVSIAPVVVTSIYNAATVEESKVLQKRIDDLYRRWQHYLLSCLANGMFRNLHTLELCESDISVELCRHLESDTRIHTLSIFGGSQRHVPIASIPRVTSENSYDYDYHPYVLESVDSVLSDPDNAPIAAFANMFRHNHTIHSLIIRDICEEMKIALASALAHGAIEELEYHPEGGHGRYYRTEAAPELNHELEEMMIRSCEKLRSLKRTYSGAWASGSCCLLLLEALAQRGTLESFTMKLDGASECDSWGYSREILALLRNSTSLHSIELVARAQRPVTYNNDAEPIVEQDADEFLTVAVLTKMLESNSLPSLTSINVTVPDAAYSPPGILDQLTESLAQFQQLRAVVLNYVMDEDFDALTDTLSILQRCKLLERCELQHTIRPSSRVFEFGDFPGSWQEDPVVHRLELHNFRASKLWRSGTNMCWFCTTFNRARNIRLHTAALRLASAINNFMRIEWGQRMALTVGVSSTGGCSSVCGDAFTKLEALKLGERLTFSETMTRISESCGNY